MPTSRTEPRSFAKGLLAAAAMLALAGCGSGKDASAKTEARVYEHAPEAPYLLQPRPLLPGHNYAR